MSAITRRTALTGAAAALAASALPTLAAETWTRRSGMHILTRAECEQALRTLEEFIANGGLGMPAMETMRNSLMLQCMS